MHLDHDFGSPMRVWEDLLKTAILHETGVGEHGVHQAVTGDIFQLCSVHDLGEPDAGLSELFRTQRLQKMGQG